MLNQEGACSQRRVNGGLARCSGACFYLRASWPASALQGVRRSQEPELGLRPQSLARATRPPAFRVSHWTKRILIGQDPRFSSGEVPSSCHWPRSRSRWPGRHRDSVAVTGMAAPLSERPPTRTRSPAKSPQRSLAVGQAGPAGASKAPALAGRVNDGPGPGPLPLPVAVPH